MSTSEPQIAEAPRWLVNLINEKKDDPANYDNQGRLCIAPGVYIRNWLTPDELLLAQESEGEA